MNAFRLLAFAGTLLGNVPLRAVEITLPPETSRLTESSLPGYALAVTHCYPCHSVDYVRYQPSTTPRAAWKAAIVKMQKTFGAPIPDAAVEPITDYLARTYGLERAGPANPPGGIAPAPAKPDAPLRK